MAYDNELLELYKQHHASQDKYTYFLLAAAGAAIGFAVQKTEGLCLTWWLLPVGLAIVCWGISFYSGCKNLTCAQNAIYANHHFLQLNDSIPSGQPTPQSANIAISTTSQAMTKNLKEAQFFAIWQFRMLIVGVVFFIGWRLLEMVRLTYAA
jgi:hypothetical protein